MKIEEIYNEWKSLFPLSEKQTQLLRKKFTTEYNFNSNHIEGNTLTYGQTELLLLFGKVSGEGDLKDFVDMKASQVGVEMVKEAVQDRSMSLTQNFIRQLHKVLLREDYTVYRDLPGGGQTSYTVHAGQYKTRPNSVITRYGDRFEYASPEETSSLMSDLVDWYNAAEQEGKLSPVELAALFHYRYIRIHPFEDGNGRIARLMVNYIMARHGWPMIVIRNRKKAEYLEALHRSDQKIGKIPSDGAHAQIGKITSFLAFFRQTVCEEMQCEIDIVRNANKSTWWRFPFLKFSGGFFQTTSWYWQIDYGWRKAFGIQLCKELKDALKRHGCLRTYEITTVKEKYGSLTIYDNGAPSEVHDILAKYEYISRRTCIECGRRAKYITQSWEEPYCEDCIKKAGIRKQPMEAYKDFDWYGWTK